MLISDIPYKINARVNINLLKLTISKIKPTQYKEQKNLEIYIERYWTTFNDKLLAYNIDSNSLVALNDISIPVEIGTYIFNDLQNFFQDVFIYIYSISLIYDRLPPAYIRNIFQSYNIPQNLSNYDFNDMLKYKLKYPLAWYREEITFDYEENIVNMLIDPNNYRILLALIQWVKTPFVNSLIKHKNVCVPDCQAIILGIDLAPVFNNPIILFRGINFDENIKIGDIITEYGFGSKSYFYDISKNFTNGKTLVIYYPPQHKLLYIPEYIQYYGTEFLSYPGERYIVDNIDEKFIYCKFFDYIPNVTTQYIGNIVVPQLDLEQYRIEDSGIIS